MFSHQHYQPSPGCLGRKCKTSGHIKQALHDLELPPYTHLSHPSRAFLPVKPNSCFQALNPRSAFLHVVLTAWNRLPRPPPPPWGPLGKLLLPFKSLIWNFCYHWLGPTIPACMELSSFQGFGIWVLKPGKIQVPGTSWSPYPTPHWQN